MPQCIVIADDLTGANATGVLLKKLNYNTYTVMNMERLELKNLPDCDCIMYPTDSRAVDKEIAYNRVFNVAGLLKGEEVLVYSKRIDSTLRGNLGSETDAILDALGNNYIAMVVPCYPASSRVLIGGYMLVNGIPLHKTEVALDPKTPVLTSKAEQLYKEQSRYPVGSIYFQDYMEGKEFIASKIKNFIAQGIRTIIFDSISQEDMDFIADAIIESKVPFVTVDPGVFTATMARKLIVPTNKKEKPKILAVVGSVNPVTKGQMEQLWLSQKHFNIFVNTKQLLEGDEAREEEIGRVVRAVLENCKEYDVCSVTGDGLFPENRIDFQHYMMKYQCSVDDVSNMINTAFSHITHRILKGNDSFKGLYTSGGDITVAVCKEFNTAGLRLLDEVVPLAAYGQFIQGEFDGIHIITKGGMVGDNDAINKCITYLKSKLYI
ncbi:uncharacterized protein YgbK (DUF1537 family) [Mobilisporobacter senegalensis]|uniref:Uncharacterized protein YgbK (DUF1537 family) n=1 Tax=Mobilisporobacter senegalensis TaxID=1329262 RepID=A0A3N1XVF3_9FIRM|nr:four-carbon acid sugar kinase family protein [Mobilisporobacter senegalensis]ROR30600.1 uncharacterized protein YgbK (DUF1537 family) [Mobilisporobacter senegalensis]